jgi:hypothetical protein
LVSLAQSEITTGEVDHGFEGSRSLQRREMIEQQGNRPLFFPYIELASLEDWEYEDFTLIGVILSG